MSNPLLPFTLGPVGATERGFPIIEFHDRYQQECSLQMSSLAEREAPGQSAVWIGLNEHRMHLDRNQVAALIHHLRSWLEHGDFTGPLASLS